MTADRPTRISVLGAPGDTGNLGVGALLHSTLAGVAGAGFPIDVTVFDNGVGVRRQVAELGGSSVRYRAHGMRLSRRVHRAESLAHMRLSARFGGVGNAGVRAMASADAVLDVSGGDSFSDIYGRKRFEQVTQPKELVLALDRPLVLLPQTYGPFRDTALARRAASVVRRAHSAWARDVDSFERLGDLLGSDLDPKRHRRTVDVAFGLHPIPAWHRLNPTLRSWVKERNGGRLVGLNLSGLLANTPDAGSRYGMHVDYPALVKQVCRSLLAHGDVRVVLIPHVVGAMSHESDALACQRLHDELSDMARQRVVVGPDDLMPGEAKWLIGQLDWFCGTRMHSTIAGLSSGVPTAAIAYSMKFRGVFASCGQEAAVADGRSLSNDEALDTIMRAFERRDEHRTVLAARLPDVRRSMTQLWQEVLAPFTSATTSAVS